MLRNLKAEMVRNRITHKQLASFLGISTKTVSNKIAGSYDWKYRETVKVRNEFFPDLEIEYLFGREEE